MHRALVVALRDIEPGEELYVDYGTGYWRRKNGTEAVQPLP